MTFWKQPLLYVVALCALTSGCYSPTIEKDAGALQRLHMERLGLVVRVLQNFIVSGRWWGATNKRLTLDNASLLSRELPEQVRSALPPTFRIVLLEPQQLPPGLNTNTSNDGYLVTNPAGTLPTYPYNKVTQQLIARNNLAGLLFVDAIYSYDPATSRLQAICFLLLADATGKTALKTEELTIASIPWTPAAREGTNASFEIEREVESPAFQKAMQEVSRELAKSIRDRISSHLK